MMFRKQKCCKTNPCGLGLFFIAIGFGLFLAYAIPRYILITLLGLGLIGFGLCIVTKK